MNARTQADFNAVAADFTKGNPARFDADGDYDRDAGLERIRVTRLAYLARQDRLSKALRVIKQDVHKESDLIRLLHCASHSLNEQKPLPTTDLAESIVWVEKLADRIQFRNDPMVDGGNDE